jgi:hypothetical protein
MNSDKEEQVASTGESFPNLIQRVMLVYFSPVKLGEILKTRWPWFWTLTITAVISALIWVVLPAELMQAAADAGSTQRPQGQQVDPETIVKMTRIFGSLGVLVMSYVAAFIVAGVLYLAFNVALGQEIAYKQHLSAISHVYWINLIGFLLLVPIWIAKTDIRVTLGFGLLLPDAPETFVGHLLNAITLFGLWSTAALGAVVSGLSGGRVPIGKAITVTMVLYALWVVLAALRTTFLGA